MALKVNAAAPYNTKKYFYQTLDAGPVRHFEYVTADAALTVEACGYIVTTTDEGKMLFDLLRVGDYIRVVTVAAIVDSRAIWQDKEAGIAGCQEVLVIRKDSDVLELSAPLFGSAAVSYTS